MKTVGIIGGGNMGSAIISRIRKNFKIQVCEQDWARGEELRKKYNVKLQSLPSLVKSSDIIIVAVKPQDIDSVLANMKAAGVNKKLVISIAAGIPIAFLEDHLGDGARVIRTMPNMPAMIGEGMTAVAQGSNARKVDMTTAQQIFNAVGKTVVIEEKWIDAVTAVSGSGPAYVFLIAECLIKAAQSLGLQENSSTALVKQTLLGSAYLLDGASESPSTLREKVTSKGGTTEAALAVFYNHNLEAIFKEALTAARDRAKELARR